jgi:hypothetical protein
MTGAIVTIAVLAALCSALATIGNFAIARDFAELKPERDADIFADPLFDPALALRYAQYRLMTNLFYHQSRVLWVLLVLLVGYKVIVGAQ